MKIANVGGRAALLVDNTAVDIASVSDGSFGPDPMSVYGRWDEFVEFVETLEPASIASLARPLVEADLGNPVPSPRQVFAIGLNYHDHAEETGLPVPDVPATFTKFPASLTGPFDDVEISVASADWEVELVAVIGRVADHVPAEQGWDVIAGLSVGQDISDRELQFAAGGQFSLGKSRRGYGPIGPWVITPDELDDPDDLALGCSIDGEVVQDSRTSQLVFSVPSLVAELSAVLTLFPGDLIFTGTPAGVGITRQPPRSLRPGEVLESWVTGIGSIKNRCVGRIDPA